MLRRSSVGRAGMRTASTALDAVQQPAMSVPGPAVRYSLEQEYDVTLPWALAALALVGFLLTTLGLLWAYGHYPWAGDDKAYTLKAFGFLLAAIAVGGLATKIPFRWLLEHGRVLLPVLVVLAMMHVLNCLFIRSDGQWIIRLKESVGRPALLAIICVLAPVIFASVLSRRSDKNRNRALLVSTAALSFSCGCIGFMEGSVEMAMLSVLTILAMAWLAGMPNALTLWAVSSVCVVGAGMILDSRPQLSAAGDAVPWPPVAVCTGAISQGGSVGVGLGAGLFPEGTPKSFYDDFLFSLVGYEMGCVGVLLVMGLWVLFALSGFHLAGQMNAPYARLCVAGTTLSFLLSALAHMGACAAVLPPGQYWLPFFSGGGESLLVGWIALGIVAAAVQHDARTTPTRADYRGVVLRRIALWRPARARILLVGFIVCIMLLGCRVASMSMDGGTGQRFMKIIERSLSDGEDPESPLHDLIPPDFAPRMDEEEKTTANQEA